MAEQETFIKEEIVEENYSEKKPEIKSQIQQPVFFWRPKIANLTDLPFLDEIDDNIDMKLGSSVLFDKKNDTTTSNENYDDEELEGRKFLSKYKIRAILDEEFERNKHPKAIQMLEVAERIGVRYRTVFERFELLRQKFKVKCAKNDSCVRIRGFFARGDETGPRPKLDNNSKRILDEEIQTHLLSRKTFGVAYLHAILEKLGPKANLSPSYVRGAYESWKKKMMTQDPSNYISSNLKQVPQDQPSLLSIDVLRKLEDAYLTKKYECEEKEWSPNEIRSLAHHLDVDINSVTEWIERRRGAILGFDHDVIEMRRCCEAKRKKRTTPQQLAVLEAFFEEDDRPTLNQRVELAEKLELDEGQIRNFFVKKRLHKRQYEEWKEAKEAVIMLPRDKIIKLNLIASQKRKSDSEKEEIAEQIGISYRILCNYIDYRRSRLNDIP